jgi:excisionase family DNA binding protein
MPKLTTTEAAERLGVSQARVRQMILAKQLTAEKVGRDWQIEERHLERLVLRPVGRPPKKRRH